MASPSLLDQDDDAHRLTLEGSQSFISLDEGETTPRVNRTNPNNSEPASAVQDHFNNDAAAAFLDLLQDAPTQNTAQPQQHLDDETIARLLQEEFDREYEQEQREATTQRQRVGVVDASALTATLQEQPNDLSWTRFVASQQDSSQQPPKSSIPPHLLVHTRPNETNNAPLASVSHVAAQLNTQLQRHGSDLSASLKRNFTQFITTATQRANIAVNTVTEVARDVLSTDPSSSLLSPMVANRSEPPSPTKSFGDSVVSHSSPSRPTFDFAGFLAKMRQPEAAPLTRYMKNFVREFQRRSLPPSEQSRVVHQFLEFMERKMSENPLWRNISEESFEQAREGLEKLLMHKLHDHVFGVPAEDRTMDKALSRTLASHAWLLPVHLDVAESQFHASYLMAAQKELLKINDYKTPRDKLICILNTCKVVYGLLQRCAKEREEQPENTTASSATAGADDFLPLLVLVTVAAHPPQLQSNVQYIMRFRHPAKLQSESGYYMTQLMSAIAFVEQLQATSLTIDPLEYERLTKEAAEKYDATLVPTSDTRLVKSSSFSQLLDRVLPGSANTSTSTPVREQQERSPSVSTQPSTPWQKPLTLLQRLLKGDSSDEEDKEKSVRSVPETPRQDVLTTEWQQMLADQEEEALQLALALSLSEQQASQPQQ